MSGLADRHGRNEKRLGSSKDDRTRRRAHLEEREKEAAQGGEGAPEALLRRLGRRGGGWETRGTENEVTITRRAS